MNSANEGPNTLRLLPRSLFELYALALPRGHGFGMRPPIGAWQSEDGIAYGVITQHVQTPDFGILVMRRRVDGVWVEVEAKTGIASQDAAVEELERLLGCNQQKEPLSANTAPRPTLHDIGNRQPSSVFRALSTPSHHVAAWTLNQLYLAMPNPDKNWAGDCQTGNFHTRLWEALLLASFREQGLLVEQPHPSPDFRIENRKGGPAWVEAVTANPPVPYDHVNAEPSVQPEAREELFFGSAAVRFAKTLGSKLQKGYHRLPHVKDMPFAIALADFHAPASMIWSREALVGYLYGLGAEPMDINGQRVAVSTERTELLGDNPFPAGLFTDERHAELSAVIFSNACSISKLSRVPISAGAGTKGFRYFRIGNFFDRAPGALKGIPFCLDVTSDEYRSLWPQGYEPWCAELEVFHNPHARHPLPEALLPEATHWVEENDEMVCRAYYETSILWSQTRILNKDDRIPALADFLPDPDPNG